MKKLPVLVATGWPDQSIIARAARMLDDLHLGVALMERALNQLQEEHPTADRIERARGRWGSTKSVLDINECNAFFPTAAKHEERVAEIEHLIDQIEYELIHEPVADDRHRYWHDQKRQIR